MVRAPAYLHMCRRVGRQQVALASGMLPTEHVCRRGLRDVGSIVVPIIDICVTTPTIRKTKPSPAASASCTEVCSPAAASKLALPRREHGNAPPVRAFGEGRQLQEDGDWSASAKVCWQTVRLSSKLFTSRLRPVSDSCDETDSRSVENLGWKFTSASSIGNVCWNCYWSPQPGSPWFEGVDRPSLISLRFKCARKVGGKTSNMSGNKNERSEVNAKSAFFWRTKDDRRAVPNHGRWSDQTNGQDVRETPRLPEFVCLLADFETPNGFATQRETM